MSAASDREHVALLLRGSSYEEYLRGLFQKAVSESWDSDIFPVPEGMPKGTSLAAMAGELNEMTSRIQELKLTKTQDERNQVAMSLFQNFVSDACKHRNIVMPPDREPKDEFTYALEGEVRIQVTGPGDKKPFNPCGIPDRVAVYQLRLVMHFLGQELALAPIPLLNSKSENLSVEKWKQEKLERRERRVHTEYEIHLAQAISAVEGLEDEQKSICALKETHGLLSKPMLKFLFKNVRSAARNAARHTRLTYLSPLLIRPHADFRSALPHTTTSTDLRNLQPLLENHVRHRQSETLRSDAQPRRAA